MPAALCPDDTQPPKSTDNADENSGWDVTLKIGPNRRGRYQLAPLSGLGLFLLDNNRVPGNNLRVMRLFFVDAERKGRRATESSACGTLGDRSLLRLAV